MQKKIAIVYFDLDIGGVQKKISDIVWFLYKKNDKQMASLDILLERKTNFTFSIPQANKIRILYKEDCFVAKITRKGINFSLYYFIFITLLFQRYDTIAVFMYRPALHVLKAMNVLTRIYKARIIVSFDISLTDAIKRGDITSGEVKELGSYLSQASIIFTCSDFIKKDLFKNKITQKVYVQPNWSNFIYRTKKKMLYDAICVGRINVDHFFPEVIQFTLKAIKQIPEIRICIVGHGSEVKRIQKMINKRKLKKNIILIGARHNPQNLLLQSRFFLSFSKEEGLPISFLEAMKSECLVIAQKYRGIYELIDNNRDGVVCNDTNQMVNRFISLRKNIRQYKDITKKALNKVTKYYSQNNISYYTNEIFSSKSTK